MKSFSKTKESIRIVMILIGTVIIGLLCANVVNAWHVSIVDNCKIKKLQQQQLISSEGTEYRYLVITDKETFICESSIVNNKYNNSDLFFSLYEDSTYSFKVSGYGKSILFDYRNILAINGSKK